MTDMNSQQSTWKSYTVAGLIGATAPLVGHLLTPGVLGLSLQGWPWLIIDTLIDMTYPVPALFFLVQAIGVSLALPCVMLLNAGIYVGLISLFLRNRIRGASPLTILPFVVVGVYCVLQIFVAVLVLLGRA